MVVLRVETQGTTNPHYLDLGDVSMKADYSILEIQDLTQRKSENTQAFTLPFSETNNDFFSHFYDVNASGAFDPNVKTNAIVSVDSIEVIEGYLQLLSVNKTTQVYEVVVYGVIANIVNQLSDLKLNDLDLSAYNHVLNITNVTDSWDGAITYTDASTGDEILYPIIDYGYGYDEDNIEVTFNQPILTCDRLKPAIKVKTVFDEILKSVGYTNINSTFLNSDFFSNQYMTLGDSSEFINNDIEDSFRIGKNYGQTFNLNTPADLVFPSQTAATGLDFHVGEGNLDANGFYTAPSDGFYKFRFTINYTSTSVAFYGFKINPIINSVVQDKTYSGNIAATSSGNMYFTITTDLMYLDSGDVLKFQGNYTGASAGNSMLILASVSGAANQTRFELIESPASSVGSTIKFDAGNNIMPKVTQIDFLKSILSRYNLVMQPSRLSQGIVDIEPIQDFFDQGASVDWTDKLDLSKPLIIKPTYEYQKDKIIFKDQEAEDYVTSEYEKKFGHPYNFYSIEIQSAFKQKGTNLEIESIFSSFTTDRIGGGVDISIARLYQINNNEIERIDAKPKLFYYSGKKTCNNFDLYESSGSASATVINEYPFCSHYSMAGQSIQETDFDIRFKSGASIGEASLVHTQPKTDTFSKCWKQHLDNLFNKDARILIANFKLTSIDIANFKYNDKIFVKDTYYRINKISNYAIGKDVSTSVEMIRVLDFEDTLAIGGCDLKVNNIYLDGEVRFVALDGTFSSGNKTCCEKNGFEWIGRDIQKCKQITDARINTQKPTAERSRIEQDTRLGTDRRTTKIKGEVKEFADSPNANDGQVASWNATDGRVDWIDASGGASGGASGDVQFNDGSNGFAGESDFNYNTTTNTLNVDNAHAVHKGTNIGSGAIQLESALKYWFLSPQDFMFGNNLTRNNYTTTNGLTVQTWQYYTTYGKFHKTIFVPIGYKVVSCFIRGNSNLSWSASISAWSSSGGAGAGNGVVNTEATGLNWVSSNSGSYYIIVISGASSSDRITGARLTLEEV